MKSPHVKHILSQITQRFYLLSQLENMAMEKSMLEQVFQSLIISRIRYAIEAMSGKLNNADIDQIDAALRKASRWGITSIEHTYRGIADVTDSNLVYKMVTNHTHVLHCMVPEIKINDRYELRNNNKAYKADIVKNNKLRYSFSQRNFSRDQR